MANPIDRFLRESKTLGTLNDKERDLLAMVMIHERFDAGEVICREGERGHCCYFVMNGEIDVEKRVAGGDTRTIATLRPDTVFGQIALVDAGTRTATCRAKSVVHVARLDRQDFDTLFASGSQFALQFSEVIARVAVQQLRQANRRLEMLLGRRKPEEPLSTDDALREVQDILAMSDTDIDVRWID